MKRDALIVLAWTAALCCPALLHGQDGRVHLPDQPGVWRSTYKSIPGDMPKASAAELATLRAALTALEQAVHATPMLTAPRGFDVHVWQRLDRGCPRNPVLCRQAPLPGWIKFDFEWYEVRNGKVMTMSSADVEPPNIDVAFNDPEATYVLHPAGNPEPTDPSGNKIVGPLVELERVGNVVIYDNGVVMLGRNPRPFFIPATREDYLRSLSTQLAPKAGAPPSGLDKDLIDALRDELAVLSPEERRSQAYTGTGASAVSRLVRASDAGATPLNKFNPAYFDPALPRTAIQLITVRFTDLENFRASLSERSDLLERSPITAERLAFLTTSGHNVASYRVFEVARLLDYSALSALLAAPAPPSR